MPNWHDQPTCNDQTIVRAPVTRVHTAPNLGKKRAVTVSAGQVVTLEWVFTDPQGVALDLSQCTSSSSSQSLDSADAALASTAWLRIKETASAVNDPSQACTEIAGTVTDAVEGVVQFPLTSAHTECHGIYLADAGMFDNAGNLLVVNSFYLVVNPSAFGTTQSRGMLSIPELRLFLRDNDAVDNELLDNVDFDAAEMAFAIEQPVLYWNESLPPTGEFTTQNFPFRHHWLLGASAKLFQIAAEHYRRNQFLTAAGGLQRDDKNKWQQYEQAAQLRWQEYTKWAQSRKIATNVSAGFLTFGSPYGRR